MGVALTACALNYKELCVLWFMSSWTVDTPCTLKIRWRRLRTTKWRSIVFFSPKRLHHSPYSLLYELFYKLSFNLCFFVTFSRHSCSSANFKMPVPFRGRFYWGKDTETQPKKPMPLSKTTKMDDLVKITRQCDSVEACTILLNTMQVNVIRLVILILAIIF